MMSAWQPESAVELGLPRLYGLDEVTGVFEGAGFSVSVANLKLGFVPVSAHKHGHDHRGISRVVGLLQPREGPASIHTPILLAVWSRARPTYERGHYRTMRPSRSRRSGAGGNLHEDLFRLMRWAVLTWLSSTVMGC